MKKPVLLLVDDDRSVLAALESALRPEFEDVCRIETFDDPVTVDTALAEWEPEERQIAVAIVDQKMPGRTGVDLLVRLRGSVAATNLHAVLLTGHAGLDSALAAKNSAGVDRYIEKPWSTAHLVETVRTLLHGYVANAGRHYFVFRQVTATAELHALFRQRYEAYQASRNARFCPPNAAGVAVDPFDLRSIHFGVFRHDNSGAAVTASIRFVTDSVGPSSSHVREIAAQHTNWSNGPAPESVLPAFTFFPDAAVITTLYREWQGRGETCVEASRLAVSPAVRTRGVIRHLLESTIAFFIRARFHRVLATCLLSHESLYAGVGFTRVPGTGTHLIEGLPEPDICVHASPADVPPAVRARVDMLVAKLVVEDKTCYCSSYPQCCPGPYVTGDFAPADVFCPIEARRVIGG